MISAAIQSTLANIITNTFMIMADENIITPYCVHRESGEPIYLKAGIVGYEYKVEVVIIDDTADKVETLVQSTKNALIALEGTTVQSTTISSVTWVGDEPDYDTEDHMYTSVITFIIQTTNR